MAKKKQNNSNKSLVLFILFLVFISIVLFLVFGRSLRSPSSLSENAYLTELKDMIVTTDDGSLHVKMSIDIESPSEEQSKSLNEDSLKIRDEVMGIVESMSDEDVSNPNVTDALKKKIKKYLDENYPGSEVVGVYFTDYITQ